MKTVPDYKSIARSILARYPNVMRFLAKVEADEKQGADPRKPAKS